MKKYFTISEFAKLRNININSLRYYEKIGVLRPCLVDENTGYRYYSPEQVAILDVVRLCTNFGMPLKELAEYIKNNNAIDNKELFETGRKMAKERISELQDELSKIEYTLDYLNNNQQYSEEKGFYNRTISKRTIVSREYTGSLTDVRRVEEESGEFQCCHMDLTPEIGIQHLVDSIYGNDNKEDIIISNMLLEKYQIGSKKSELQKLNARLE